MEKMQCLAAFLLATSAAFTRASPVNVPECTLEPLTKDHGVKVFYTTSRVANGCTSQGPTDPSLEVHLLFLRFSSPSELFSLQINVSASAEKANRRSMFVVSSNAYVHLTVNTEGCHLTFITTTRCMVQGANIETQQTNLSSSSEELLQQTKKDHGGISSFAELENPRQIHFHLDGEPSSNQDCVPEKNFNADPYLEFEVASDNVKGCPSSSGNPQKEAHIVWLQQDPQGSSPQSVDLNIEQNCDEGEPENQLPTLLVLKSHTGVTWNIGQMFDSLKFLVSGKYTMKKFGAVQMPGVDLPDSKEGLLAESRSKEFAFVASYTEITSAKSITLKLERVCGRQATPVTEKPQMEGVSLESFMQGLITTWKPWRCLDSGIEITLAKDYLRALFENVTKVTDVTLQDRSCKATDNNTHFILRSKLRECSTYLERDVVVKNQLVFSLHLLPGEIMVPFECDLPEKVFLQLYPSPDFGSEPTTVVEVNKATYVQVQFRTTDLRAQLQIEDCSLQTADKTSSQLLIGGGKPLSYSATFLDSPSSTISRFSFVYKSGEEQWAASPATLLCKLHLHSQLHGDHYNETSLEMTFKTSSTPSHSLGIGTVLGITFGAFLIGVLLTAALWYIYSHTHIPGPMAKMQPVAENPPASESSSTNHSIGSTQSTPCSTSSMA
ncbi:endoglin isoform X2 [Sceloporus undulatus]|uniref:endoglin isoform X2 n=1 Tax=Sceloporus undulatus TaxID=8520 RepID=UPI001C4A7EC7|nr:endoglin isoform X2 [Sceloporus undulatus]